MDFDMFSLIPAQIKHLEICSKSLGIEILRTDLLFSLHRKCVSGRRNAYNNIVNSGVFSTHNSDF